MSWFNRGAVAALAVAGLLLLAPALASAHEHREIAGGRYTMVVGFSSEPAYTGFLNGLDLRVTDNSQATPAAGGAPTGAPVEGLEQTLKADIIYGNQTRELTLEPRYNTPGAYDGWIVPMAAGDYSFHIYGTIGDTPVDETFTSSPEGFSAVTDQATIQFPANGSSTANAPLIGSVSNGGIDLGTAGGAVAGLVAGAAGLTLIQRRRATGKRPATAQAGIGD
jgi:hypothetical protein